MKYREQIIKDIEEGLTAGLSQKAVCDYVGISTDTFYEWVKTKPDFSDRIKKVTSIKKRELLRKIEAAGTKNWTAWSWILERCYPDEFALRTKTDFTFSDKTMTQEQRDREIERLIKLRAERNGVS